MSEHYGEEGIFYKELSYKVIGLAMEVHRTLGPGFLEEVYENALMVALRKAGIKAKSQAPFEVYFMGESVGQFFADILVEDVLILELKAREALVAVNRAQVVNYLKVSKLHAAYLINFGKTSLEYERFVN